jgi:hypothetical protein
MFLSFSMASFDPLLKEKANKKRKSKAASCLPLAALL